MNPWRIWIFLKDTLAQRKQKPERLVGRRNWGTPTQGLERRYRPILEGLEVRQVPAGEIPDVYISGPTQPTEISEISLAYIPGPAQDAGFVLDPIGLTLGEVDRRFGREIVGLGGGKSRIDVGQAILNVAGTWIGVPYAGTLFSIGLGLLDRPNKNETPQHIQFSLQTQNTEEFVRSVFISAIDRIDDADIRQNLKATAIRKLDEGVEASKRKDPNGDNLFIAQRTMTAFLKEHPQYLPPVSLLPHPTYNNGRLWDTDPAENARLQGFMPFYSALVAQYRVLVSEAGWPSEQRIYEEVFGVPMSDSPADYVGLYEFLQPIISALPEFVEKPAKPIPQDKLSAVLDQLSSVASILKSELSFAQKVLVIGDTNDELTRQIETLKWGKTALQYMSGLDDAKNALRLLGYGLKKMTPTEQAETYSNLFGHFSIGSVHIPAGLGSPAGSAAQLLGIARIASKLDNVQRAQLIQAFGGLSQAIPGGEIPGAIESLAGNVIEQWLQGRSSLDIVKSLLSLVGNVAGEVANHKAGQLKNVYLGVSALVSKLQVVTGLVGQLISHVPEPVPSPEPLDYGAAKARLLSRSEDDITTREGHVGRSPNGDAFIVGGYQSGPAVGGGAVSFVFLRPNEQATIESITIDMYGANGRWGWGAHSRTGNPIRMEVNGTSVGELTFSAQPALYGDVWHKPPGTRETTISMKSVVVLGSQALTIRSLDGSVIDVANFYINMSVSPAKLNEPVEAPQIISPMAGVDSAAGTRIKWAAQKGAERFQIAITDDNGRVIRELVTDENEAVVEVGASGDRWVRVRAINSQVVGDWSLPVLIAANDSPVVTSPTAVRLDENSREVMMVAATDDAPTANLRFTIGGGADAGKFVINETSGALSFVVPPDFERPADVDGNNAYDVVIQVADQMGGITNHRIAVSVVDVIEMNGTITGHVFIDSDRNGMESKSEQAGQGRGGRTVFLDANANGALDAGEPRTETTADGTYGFYGLQVGDNVRVQLLGASTFESTNATFATVFVLPQTGGPSFGAVATLLRKPAIQNNTQANRAWVLSVYAHLLGQNASSNPRVTVFTNRLNLAVTESARSVVRNQIIDTFLKDPASPSTPRSPERVEYLRKQIGACYNLYWPTTRAGCN